MDTKWVTDDLIKEGRNMKTKKTTEQKVNEFLQKTLKTARELDQAGRHDAAKTLLSWGSTVAHTVLLVAGVRYHHIQCNNGHLLHGKIEQEAWIKHGICLWCDHLASDRYWEEDWMTQGQEAA